MVSITLQLHEKVQVFTARLGVNDDSQTEKGITKEPIAQGLVFGTLTGACCHNIIKTIFTL